MKKRIMALTLALALVLLAGCSGRNDAETTAPSTQATETSAAEQETEQPTEQPTEESTEAATETETEESAAGESGQASNGTYRDDVSVTELRDAVKEAYGENYIPSMEYDADTLEALFGVSSDMYDEVIAEGPMISVHVDTLIIVKAKNDRVEDVRTALENYRNTQIETGMNYPMNVPKLQASEVAVFGNYVCYIMLGAIDESITDEGEMLTAFQEQNQIAVDVIEGMLAE